MKCQLGAKRDTVELRGTMDRFGHLLYLSTLRNTDMENVFCYPVPLSLDNVDDSVNKTKKSKLMHKLQSRGNCNTLPASIDVVLVDAVFLLQTMINVATVVPRILSEMCKPVHLVYDTYLT